MRITWKHITISAIILLVVIALILYLRKKDPEEESGEAEEPLVPEPSLAPPATGSTSGWTQPYQWGSGTTANPCQPVRRLQTAMNHFLQKHISVDGAWGRETENAVAKLRENSLRLNNHDMGIFVDYNFAAYIDPVQRPKNAASHWQLTNAGISGIESLVNTDLRSGGYFQSSIA